MRAVRDGTVMSPVSTGDVRHAERVAAARTDHLRARPRRTSSGRAMSAHRAGFVGTYDDAGKLARVRVRRGTHFAAGDVIATVNPFNHVHLNVGWPGEEVNPLRLRLSQFSDTIAPTIAARRRAPLQRKTGTPVPRVRVQAAGAVSGRVRIVVDAWDQADGNRPNRRLGLYALGYEVLSPDGSARRQDSDERPIGSSSIGWRFSPMRAQARLCAWQRHSFLWRAAHALPLCRDQHVSSTASPARASGTRRRSRQASTLSACARATSAATKRKPIATSGSWSSVEAEAEP